MRVSNLDSMYPVIRRISNEVSSVANKIKKEKPRPVSIDAILDNLNRQKEETLPKPGKGFYIVINDANSNSYLKRAKSTLTPMQQRINKTYRQEVKPKTGLLVDMTV